MRSLEPWVLRETGCAGRAELEAWQMARLREAVDYARKSSRFYRERLRGVDTARLQTRAELTLLPFTTAEDLRGRGDDWLCRPASQVERVVTLKTSGTTAAPKRVCFTRADLDRTTAFFAHGMPELIEPGWRVGVLMPAARPDSVGDLLARALEAIPAAAVRLGPVADIEETYQKLYEARCDCVVGIPVQVLALAQYGAAQPCGGRLSLRSALLSADAAPGALLRQTEELLGCPVFTHFGMTELGFGAAVECSERCGCHVRENDILAEVVDPESGEPLPPGAFGELVFTTLRREAMPFLRYRSGDRGALLTGRCACGSVLHRVVPAGGRLADGRGGLSLWELDELLFSCHGVTDYRARLREDALRLSVYGVEPPDPLRLRAELEALPLPDALRGKRIEIECRRIGGFSGTGMEKRTLWTE